MFPIVTPQDPRYDAARRLWNGAIDRRPELIAQPRTPGEVAAAIRHARDRDLPLAVRGGGHSIPGHSMADGGLTIDLGAFRSVDVDPVTRTAAVGGGALLDDVMVAAEPHALTMPFGHVSHTGVGGLTLGGGLGWVMRRDGMAVDRLRACELVTADGECVRASLDEHPDLFWALRGGGGNFGVVTGFEFDLAPFGPEVLAGMVLYALDDAGDALRHCRDFMAGAPEELSVYEVFMVVPPAPPFPEALHGRPAMVVSLVYAGDPEEGERVVEPLRRFGRPALDLVGRMPPTAVQRMLDPTAPHGLSYSTRSHWLAGLPDEAVDTLVDLHERAPSPMSQVITARMGGAVAREPEGGTAFGHRDTDRVLWIITAWDRGDGEHEAAWCREVFDASARWSTGGVYVNAVDVEAPSRVRAAYEDATWQRLREVKAAWDPENVFRLNPNIAPAQLPARAA